MERILLRTIFEQRALAVLVGLYGQKPAYSKLHWIKFELYGLQVLTKACAKAFVKSRKYFWSLL